MEESVIPPPERSLVSYHHTSEFTTSRQPEQSTIDAGERRQAEVAYLRPLEDKVAAY